MAKEGVENAGRTIFVTVGVICLLLLGNYLDFWFGRQSPFAPKRVACPSSEPVVRAVPFDKQTIADDEKDWVENRQKETREAWRNYLTRANLSDEFDVEKFLKKKKLPTVALAFSGGGSR
jgi:hypothetical protein